MKTPAILKLAYRRPLRFLYCVAFSFWYFARHVLDGLRYMATPAREAPIARDKREILYIIANIDFFKDANHVVGGHITHVLGVIRGLAKAGYRVHVLTTQAVPFLDQPDCIQHVIAPERTLPELPLVDYLPWHRQLYRDALRLVGERPIAFIYQRHTNLVFSGGLIAHRLGVPEVLEVNSPVALMDGGLISRLFLFKFFEKVAFRLAQRMIVVSEVTRDILRSNYAGVDVRKIITIPNGVDPQMFSPDIPPANLRAELGIADDVFLVGFSGNFRPWHGIDVLLEAYRRFRETGARSHLVLIGGSENKAEYETKVREMGLADGVTFLGTVPFDQMPSHLVCFDVLVSPQVPLIGKTFHGSPTKLFEYLAVGKPVIASRIGQLAEVIEHEQNGLLVEPGSANELAAALRRVYDDRAAAARLGANARRTVLERYTWDQNANQVLAALRS